MLTSLVRLQRDSIVYGHCLPALASLANLGFEPSQAVQGPTTYST